MPTIFAAKKEKKPALFSLSIEGAREGERHESSKNETKFHLRYFVSPFVSPFLDNECKTSSFTRHLDFYAHAQ